MKKLLIYFNSIQPAGGIERVITTLCDKLSLEFEITVLVKDEPVSFYKLDEKIKIHSLNNELKFDMQSRVKRVFAAFNTILLNVSKLRAYLKANPYDYYYLAHPLNVLEFNLAGADTKKMVITEHGARSAYNTVYKLIKRLLYHRCKAYVVPTKTDTALYLSDGFPAVYVPHFRSQLPYINSDKTEKSVLNIGRFTSDKQQLALLEIWNNIVHVRGIMDWKLKIAGSGELEKELHFFVQENGLNDYVQFLQPTKNVENFYKSASIFALTSSSEGFGMVLLEAISFGLPCVSFDCPSGPRDIIQDGVNGFLVELNDQQTFEMKLVDLMMNRDKIIEIGEAAYKTSEEWADGTILERWFDILKN